MTRTPLEHRWNVAATRAGLCGSEFIDDPEFVFDRVIDWKMRLHKALLEVAKLRREKRELANHE